MIFLTVNRVNGMEVIVPELERFGKAVTSTVELKRHNEQVQWFRAPRQATNRACIVSVFPCRTWFSCRGLTFRPRVCTFLFMVCWRDQPSVRMPKLCRREVVYISVHFSKREKGTVSSKLREDSAGAFPSWPPPTTYISLCRRTAHHEYTLG
jgi:hypothetical protein